MKKLYVLLLAICLLLAACGEKPSSEPEKEDLPPAKTETENTQQEPQSPAKEEEPAPVVPDESWRDGYAGFLKQLAEELVRFRNFTHPDYDPNAPEGGADVVMGTYMLYDIDKSGIPELLIRYGLGEAGYHTTVYGYEAGEVVVLGDIPTGHTGLYSWPGENGLAYNWGHMGGHFVDKVILTDGKLVQEKFFEEGTKEPVMEYTTMEEILPGSIYLREAPTFVELPEIRALTLPIYEYGVQRTAKTDPARQAAVKSAVDAVLHSGAEFYGVSVDGFGGNTGWTTMERYLKPGGVTEFADRPLEIKEPILWADLNGDGLEEAVLTIKNGEGDPYGGLRYVILTEEDGTVYAYCLNYMFDYALKDGVFVDEVWSGERFAVSFGGGQAYQYTPGQELP